MEPVPEQDLDGHEKSMRAAIAEAHPAELQLVSSLVECILRGFLTMGTFTKSPSNRLQLGWLLLATRSFNSLRSAWLLLAGGYYSQALLLVRSAMEDNLTALDCEGHPETLASLLDAKGELGRGQLRFTAMADRVSATFSAEWRYNYGKLSDYAAHARHNSVRYLIDPDTQVLRLGAYYDRDLVDGTVDALLYAGIGTADLVAKILGDRAEPWQIECFDALLKAKNWRDATKRELDAETSPDDGR